MIRHLYIKDFILIRELSIDLQPGFTAITGETGAGKSILIGAIGLILGARADSKTVRQGAKKAIIEAECSVQNLPDVRAFFEKNDLDYSDISILRRELTPNGSRAFINDTPVTTTLLRQIGEYLVDIHSQHHNMLIGNPTFQLSVLDTLADNHELLDTYRSAYHEYHQTQKALKDEKSLIEAQRKEEDYIRFQYNQLEEAKLVEGELQEVESQLNAAQHTQGIIEALSALVSLDENYSDSPSIAEQISAVTKQLLRESSHHPKVSELSERLTSLQIELSDLIGEADTLRDNIDLDPAEKIRLEERMDLLQSLMYKHNVQTNTELIQVRDEYRSKLDRLSLSDEHIGHLQAEVDRLHEEAKGLAKKLHDSRAKASKDLLPDLHDLMKELAIAGATFDVDIRPTATLTPTGMDEVSFMLATNKNTHLQPIHEIASGGEVSRFMLALKTIIAKKAVLPTVIFDEIDTGVSGEVAERLGRVMYRLSQNLQVLSITHLPQIAALADHQLVVQKTEEDNGFWTEITPVKGNERVKQLASMLSGTELTSAAMDNARELLKRNKKK